MSRIKNGSLLNPNLSQKKGKRLAQIWVEQMSISGVNGSGATAPDLFPTSHTGNGHLLNPNLSQKKVRRAMPPTCPYLWAQRKGP
eukprot:gene22455-8951_t